MHVSVAHYPFETSGFIDAPGVREARVNEHIGSMSLATWLSEALKKIGIDSSAPWGEDHGCDFSVTHQGKTYLCVCHTDDSDDGLAAPTRYAYVLLVRHRSLFDYVRGRNKASPNDPVAGLILDCLDGHPEITSVELG